MILDFLIVLMTKNLSNQVKFYKNAINLEITFDHQEVVGFGKNNRTFIVLREDKSEDSHHLADHKGPQILTFKCEGEIEQSMKNIRELGYKVRDTLKLTNLNTYYLFIEDFDGNEICLDFPLNMTHSL